jgi:glutamine---fructose-6-phosphate transaminase (isomerizing)
MRQRTQMLTEACEAPDVVARQLSLNAKRAEALGAALRARDPALVVVCGRGSSDCAGLYAKYLIETRVGVMVAQMAPSVVSIYQAPLRLSKAAFIVISQSGRSPDLLAAAEAAKRAGALVITIVNDETSPLASLAEVVLPMHAGPERSVAATKSFVASLSAIAHLVACWREDGVSLAALNAAPDLLRSAVEADWSAALPIFQSAPSAIVLSRGLSFAIAQEAALKLKETCALHAEAYSAAELRHGPVAMLRQGSPVLAFRPSDASGASMAPTLAQLRDLGAAVIVAGVGEALPFSAASPEVEPMAFVLSLYGLASDLALLRGLNPDSPPSLRKVTETL